MSASAAPLASRHARLARPQPAALHVGADTFRRCVDLLAAAPLKKSFENTVR